MEKTVFELRNEKLAPKVIRELESRNFQAYYCPTAAEARDKALSLIPESDTVSWGGSVTIQEIGLIDALYDRGYSVLDRDKASTPEERMEIMRQALTCDTFLTSTNALTEDGELVNIDGNGNRVAAMIFGPRSVIVIAGMNKVVKTLADAQDRARYYAAPINVQKFEDCGTPCYISGACAHCKSDDCICAYLVTTRMSRPKHKIKVILVGDSLGF